MACKAFARQARIMHETMNVQACIREPEAWRYFAFQIQNINARPTIKKIQ